MDNRLVNIEKNNKIETKLKQKNSNKEFLFAKFNKSCLVTYVGIIFGVLTIYFSVVKISFKKEWYIRYSLSCLIIAGVCDMFDGKFARSCKRTEEEKAFGVQLDSLADTICFIIAPVVIMLSLGMTEWYFLIVYILLIICGISRLGYFNIKVNLDKSINNYSGLPVTSTAIIYPLICLLHLVIYSRLILSAIYWITTVLVAILFVVNIKIPKTKGIAYIIIPILSIIGIVLLVVIK